MRSLDFHRLYFVNRRFNVVLNIVLIESNIFQSSSRTLGPISDVKVNLKRVDVSGHPQTSPAG